MGTGLACLGGAGGRAKLAPRCPCPGAGGSRRGRLSRPHTGPAVPGVGVAPPARRRRIPTRPHAGGARLWDSGVGRAVETAPPRVRNRGHQRRPAAPTEPRTLLVGGQGPGGHGAGAAAAGRGGDVTTAGARRGGWRVPLPGNGRAWGRRTAAARAGRGGGAAELILSYEDVFRFAFQEVPVQQATEGVSPLGRILEMNSEGKPGCGPGHILCSESRRLWGALQNTDSTSTSRWLWSESRCQENLLLVLGMDAARKNLSGDLGHILECSDLQEPEELGVRTVCAQPCRALVHTQLSGPSGGRQGILTAWSLFLKTPLRSSGQYIPVPRKKKIYSPRNLKMTLFNSNVC
uniref:uncharacterized protein CLBA1 isoform X1 n=1 Tax=Panthera onca TaxID=9690 RepID=UPI002955C325|nr:uncharacterized protein CLBA1 isoform X1 [Panthera onca]